MLGIMMLMAMVVHATTTVTATWDFTTMAAGEVYFEDTSGELESTDVVYSTGSLSSDVTGVKLYIDATNGKFYTRGAGTDGTASYYDAQFNNGAIIQVPVQSTSDIVIVTAASNSGAYNFTVGTVSGAAVDGTSVVASSGTTSYTATATDVSKGYVEILATGTTGTDAEGNETNQDAYLYTIVVQQVTKTVISEKATWDFTTMDANEVNIQYNSTTSTAATGTVASDVDGVALYVTASQSGAKLQTRGSDAQFNTGATIQVPVSATTDIVTVTGYPGYCYYTVGGTAASNTGSSDNVTTHNPTETEVTAGYVEIVSTGSAYLYSITVEPEAEKVKITEKATWDFSTMGEGTVNIQGATGTVASDVEDIVLTVDATNSGKLYTRATGNSAQFNQNTIIYVPVSSEGDVVTVVGHSGYIYYTVGGTAASTTETTTTYEATAADVTAGYVAIVSTGGAYIYSITVDPVSTTKEKQLYSTTFTTTDGWADASAATSESTVSQSTKYTHETLTFTLYNTAVSTSNSNDKLSTTGGYLMANKSSDPYVVTSKLSNISKVHFIHGATGGSRGWGLYCKGAGDDDWVLLSDSYATTQSGTEVTVEVDRDSCQLKFVNLNSSQNAYLMQLDIYGDVDMGSTPVLGTLTVNGTEYEADDIFSDTDDEYTKTATIEIASSESMPSTSNPVTATAENGTVGTISSYVYYSNGTTTEDITTTDSVIVTIPVTYESSTVNYVATFIRKPYYTLTYVGTDGETVLGTQSVEKDASITAFSYITVDNDTVDASTMTVADGYAFRGWFAAASGSGNRKYTIEDVVTSDLTLYAVATAQEVKSATARYTYTLTDQYFYAEDHEGFEPVTTTEGSDPAYYNSTHGWLFPAGSELKILVGGKAYIMMQLCQYSADQAITIKSSTGTQVGSITSGKASSDGATTSYNYTGDADTLTLSFAGNTYLHSLTIMNDANGALATNEAGWYVVEAGNADNFLSILDVANANASSTARTYIYVPAGTYDLGEAVLTEISGDNISIIGDSIGKTIIKNTPKVETESINNTATILVTGSNTYLQDLTLQDALDYYTAMSTIGNGRGVVLQDKGNRTICKNVNLQSYQDTYYSNADGQYYFEGGEIHGTVDYLCGSGDVYFKGVRLINESRSASGETGQDVIAAPNTSSACSWGYVLDSCTIETHSATLSLARSWNNQSKTAYLNTIILEPSKLISTRFTTAGMNVAAYSFKEYNSVDESGNVVSPSSNTLTFTHSTGNYTYETILTADEAANYNIDKVFTDWEPDVLATQLEMGTVAYADNKLSWTAVDNATGYAIFKDGEFVDITTSTSYAITESGTYSVRAANSMGGFGDPSTCESTLADITKSIGASGYGTYSAAYNTVVPEGVTVYTAAIQTGESTTTILATSIDAATTGAVLPANVGFIIKGTVSTDYTFAAATTDAISLEDVSNDLKANTVATTVESGNNWYGLLKSTATFAHITGGTLAANTAYVILSESQAKNLTVVFDDEATGITEVVAEGVADGKIYNLAGQQVNGTQKGIVIMNGKKYVIK